MTPIRNFDEALEALAKYIPLTRQITGKDITLERMEPLMKALGNPEKRLRVIHVAGTSGKTSTCYFLASLLTSAGRRVGLTVSPHVDSVTERLQVNMQPVPEPEFATAVGECLEILQAAEVEPTYFELLVGLAYWYFDKTGVDYVVAETGLGGLQDATNIAGRADKVCIITDIGLDHMHILGESIREIAWQKAGIIHEGNQVFCYRQDDEVMEVIEAVCAQKSASLNIVPDIDEESDDLPRYQCRNFHLARRVYEHIAAHDGLPLLSEYQLANAREIYVPARMDQVKIGSMQIIMDGAHNEQKMLAFVESFKEKLPNKQVPVLLSLKLGKEFMTVLPIIKPITSKLILTSYTNTQDLPTPSIDAGELAAAAKKFGFDDITQEPDPAKAYEILKNTGSELGVITGSFYLIFQLRQYDKELRHG